MVNRHVIRNPFVSIGGVDLSLHVAKVKVMWDYEEVPATTGNATGAKGRAKGLIDHTFEFEFVQDFDAAKVNATLAPLALGFANFPVIAGYSQAVAAPETPRYSGDCHLFSYVPFDAAIGELVRTTIVLPGDGNFAIDIGA